MENAKSLERNPTLQFLSSLQANHLKIPKKRKEVTRKRNEERKDKGKYTYTVVSLQNKKGNLVPFVFSFLLSK